MDKKIYRNKWVLYTAFMFLIALLETTLFPKIRIFGSSPTQLLPYAICVIAMLEGAHGGALAGLIAGLMSDIMLSAPDGFYTVVYVLCGIGVAFLCTLVFWKNFPVTLLYYIAFTLVSLLIYYILFFLIFGDTNISAFLLTFPADFFVNALFSILVYIPIYLIAKRSGYDEEA